LRQAAIALFLLSACTGRKAEPEDRSVTSLPVEQSNEARSEAAGNLAQPVQSSPDVKGHPCDTQDGEPVTHELKALGTEPFWAAEVQGRCVTYRTPEDQHGTRVWTHVDTGPQGPAWNGALRGKQFQLYVKPAPPPGCSDGMSDKVYSMDAVLRVDGETRKGCAEQL